MVPERNDLHGMTVQQTAQHNESLQAPERVPALSTPELGGRAYGAALARSHARARIRDSIRTSFRRRTCLQDTAGPALTRTLLIQGTQRFLPNSARRMRMHVLQNRPERQDAASAGHMTVASPPATAPQRSPCARHPVRGSPTGARAAASTHKRQPLFTAGPGAATQPRARTHICPIRRGDHHVPPASRRALWAARRLCRMNAWPAGPNPRTLWQRRSPSPPRH